MRFMVWGVMPIGALCGGVLGSGAALGLRPTLAVAGVGAMLSPLPVVLSPLRRVRVVSEAAGGS